MSLKTDSRRKDFPFLIQVALLFLMFIACVLLFALTGPLNTLINRTDEFSTVNAFAIALSRNRLEDAKAYVSSELRAFVDRWGVLHQPIPSGCRAPSDPDDNSRGWGSGYADKDVGVGWYLRYECPFRYELHISANLKRTSAGWQIVDIIILCEQRQFSQEKCYK